MIHQNKPDHPACEGQLELPFEAGEYVISAEDFQSQIDAELKRWKKTLKLMARWR